MGADISDSSRPWALGPEDSAPERVRTADPVHRPLGSCKGPRLSIWFKRKSPNSPQGKVELFVKSRLPVEAWTTEEVFSREKAWRAQSEDGMLS